MAKSTTHFWRHTYYWVTVVYFHIGLGVGHVTCFGQWDVIKESRKSTCSGASADTLASAWQWEHDCMARESERRWQTWGKDSYPQSTQPRLHTMLTTRYVSKLIQHKKFPAKLRLIPDLQFHGFHEYLLLFAIEFCGHFLKDLLI